MKHRAEPRPRRLPTSVKRRASLSRASAYGLKGISLVVTIAASVAVSTGSAMNPSAAPHTALESASNGARPDAASAAPGARAWPGHGPYGAAYRGMASGPLLSGATQPAAETDPQEQIRRAVAARAQAQGRARALRVSRDRERARLADLDPRVVARQLAALRGWGATQFSCLDSLWTKESGWSHTADNPSSSAFGIPQALPGSKMATAGPDWRTNPVTQVRWGLGYIAASYGTPCAAWAHSRSNNWY